MNQTKLTAVKNDFAKTMESMMTKAQSAKGAFARIYPLYQKFQVERFQSQNASEGSPWPSLNSQYQDYKKRRYGGGDKRDGGQWKSWPGSGSKMLIGTSSLAGAVIGPSESNPFFNVDAHKAIFTSTSMTISVDESGTNAESKQFDYPHIVNQTRNFMTFSDEHIGEMKDVFRKFIIEDGE